MKILIISNHGEVIVGGDNSEITTDFCAILIALIQKGCTPAIITSLGVVLDNDAKEITKHDKDN